MKKSATLDSKEAQIFIPLKNACLWQRISHMAKMGTLATVTSNRKSQLRKEACGSQKSRCILSVGFLCPKQKR